MNAFTVDVEDWFCAYTLRRVIREDQWDSCELRVVGNVRRILALLERFDAKATFFVLGWIAAKVPFLVREIADSGHEIATHGYSHVPVTEMTPPSFERDLERALEVTESLIEGPVVGFRAPVFTVTPSTLWALDILRHHGMKYDSSVFPFSLHPDYGMPAAPLSPHKLSNSLVEVPLSCVELAGCRIPVGGGGYFRLFPYCVFKKLMKLCNRQGRPVIFYIHPWEIDPYQQKMRLSPFMRFRHYNNLHKTFGRLERLLGDFRFTSIGRILREENLITC